MKEIGIFSRTYEIGDLEETYRRMTANGITHTQFNLSNAGLPSLPEHVAETKLSATCSGREGRPALERLN